MKYVVFCVLIYTSFGCQTQSDVSLQLASTAEIVEMHKMNQFDVEAAIFLKQDGRKVDANDVRKMKDRTYSCDYFVDDKGVIRKAVVRPTTYKDHIRSILINNIGYDPKYKTPLLNIDCDSLSYNIEKIREIQLEDWPDEIPFKDTLGHFDFLRAKLVAIDENCHESLANYAFIIWNMVHHNTKEVIAHYYLLLEGYVESGHLKEGVFALMTDRLLIGYQYPQVFGSQILDGKLYPIESPESVDIRRANVGLEPLDEYLQTYFGLSWPPKGE